MRLIQRAATSCRTLLHAIAGGRDPEAMLTLERENLRQLMEQSSRGLASHAGLAERLMSRSRLLEQEELTQRLRVAVRLRVGSRAEAGRAALELQTVQRELASHREQLALAEDLHQSLTKARELAIAAAKARIESVRRTIGDRRAQQAMDGLDEIAAGTTAAIDGNPTLGRLREMVGERRHAEAGRAQAAHALGFDGQPGHKAEQAALAAALEEFLAQDGGLVVEVGAPPIVAPGRSNE